MKTTQHTPGPWKSSDRWGNFGDYNRHENDAPNGQVSRYSYSVVDEEGFIVAHCTNPLVTMSSERSEANAQLIAAAPDLLDALLEARDFIGCLLSNTPTEATDLLTNHGEDVEERLNVAIAKATNPTTILTQ